MLRLYIEGQPPIWESLETTFRRVGGWCEMAASLPGHEPGSRVWYVGVRSDNHVNYNECSFRTGISGDVTKKGRLSRGSVAMS
jgi:hypothetical protein